MFVYMYLYICILACSSLVSFDSRHGMCLTFMCGLPSEFTTLHRAAANERTSARTRTSAHACAPKDTPAQTARRRQAAGRACRARRATC